MNYIGIDIGSTAAKVCLLKGDEKVFFKLPTGWSSLETANLIKEKLKTFGVDLSKDDSRVVATGYGRVAVDYADFVITEITCHGRGGRQLAGDNIGIIDLGGQDTKAILLENGLVKDFLMNDKCSAGTGKFLEVMANKLVVSIDQLFKLAQVGQVLPISSLCTVFAESEIISYIGQGQKREDIAAGVVDSVAAKVSQLARRLDLPKDIILTGGLSGIDYFAQVLSEKLEANVRTTENGIYAGALGAALLAKEKKKR
ncbi:MAG: acyl-CoA dehydratase activase [Bacillota bacterium]|nr:acyl-CoA dehydratase activase [Bacillota bacterium]